MKYGIEGDREVITLWQVVVPVDMDRVDYIQQCLMTSTISIIGREGGIVHDIPCPDFSLQQIDFPQKGELGSQIICGNVQVDGNEQLVVLNVIRTRDKVFTNIENAYRLQKISDKGEAEITIKGKKGDIYLSVSSTEEDGGNVIINVTNAQDSGKLELNVNGDVDINAHNVTTNATTEIVDAVSISDEAKHPITQVPINEDNYSTTFTKTLKGFQVKLKKGLDLDADQLVTTIEYNTDVGFSYLDEHGNRITLGVDILGNNLLDVRVMLDKDLDEYHQILADKEKFQINSQTKVLNLGDGSEAMVLGNILAQLLKDLITEISIATTPSGPLGNAAAIAAYVAEVDSILSTYSNTQ